MAIKIFALAGALCCYAAPAAAQDAFTERRGTPKPITHFEVADQSVELVAVTRRARANTRAHRAYMRESIALSKAIPGYPTPALLSVDVRVKF